MAGLITAGLLLALVTAQVTSQEEAQMIKVSGPTPLSEADAPNFEPPAWALPIEEEEEEGPFTGRVPPDWLRPVGVDEEEEAELTEREPPSWHLPVDPEEEDEEVEFTERVPPEWVRPISWGQESESFTERSPSAFVKPLPPNGEVPKAPNTPSQFLKPIILGGEENQAFTERSPSSFLKPLPPNGASMGNPFPGQSPSSFLKPFPQNDGLEGRLSPPEELLAAEAEQERSGRPSGSVNQWVTPFSLTRKPYQLISEDTDVPDYGKFELASGVTVTFSSLGYPRQYPAYVWSTLQFKAAESPTTLQLRCTTFEMGQGDYLLVHQDNGNRLTLSGKQQPDEAITSEDEMMVEFRSNKQASGRGRKIDLNDRTCGKTKYENRIIGGEQAAPHAYPWLVTLQFSKSGRQFCGGSILNERFILTAAHCVMGSRASKISVGVSKHRRKSDPDGVIMQVQTIRIHENYNANTQNNDIAILKLKKSLRSLLNDQKGWVRSVCLPIARCTSTSTCFQGRTATLAGWGLLDPQALEGAPAVQFVRLPVMTNKACQDDYKKYRIGITSKMVCAGVPQGGVDSCQGDSGGPMTVTSRDGTHTQIGVVSFGRGCALPGAPGVYTRVSELTNWIRKHTRL